MLILVPADCTKTLKDCNAAIYQCMEDRCKHEKHKHLCHLEQRGYHWALEKFSEKYFIGSTEKHCDCKKDYTKEALENIAADRKKIEEAAKKAVEDARTGFSNVFGPDLYDQPEDTWTQEDQKQWQEWIDSLNEVDKKAVAEADIEAGSEEQV